VVEEGEDLGGDDLGGKKAEADEYRDDALCKIDEGYRDQSSNQTFLPTASISMLNLKPDAGGRVVVPLEKLKGKSFLRVVAVDSHSITTDSIALAGRGFDAVSQTHSTEASDKVVTEKREIHRVTPNVECEITGKQWEAFATVEKLCRLYSTIAENHLFDEFRFIANWHEQGTAEKARLYTRYACHELNFFLYKKDPQFFADVVKPFIANKYDKTFMDRYLLGDDLTEYCKLWRFEELNLVEKILLAEKVEVQQDVVRRLLSEQFALLQINDQKYNELFDTALQQSVLDVGAGEPMKAYKPQTDYSQVPAPAKVSEDEEDEDLGDLDDLDDLDGQDDDFGDDLGSDDEATKSVSETTDKERRTAVRQFYRPLEPTKSWVENTYYQDLGEKTFYANRFWLDFLNSFENKQPFISKHILDLFLFEKSDERRKEDMFTELMFAAAVLDLPFEQKEISMKDAGSDRFFRSEFPAIIFEKRFMETEEKLSDSKVVVNRDLFRVDDRFVKKDNEKVEKYISGELQTRAVYGAKAVVTNSSSAKRKLNVQLEIPEGAIPVGSGRSHDKRYDARRYPERYKSIIFDNGLYSSSQATSVDAYSSKILEYYFYFPTAGDFELAGVVVSEEDVIVGKSELSKLLVTTESSTVDTSSWEYVSQYGTEEQVLKYLETQNLRDTKLELIAWRMRHKEFFTKVISLLRQNHVFDETLWSYGVEHKDEQAVEELLQNGEYNGVAIGEYIESPLFTSAEYDYNWYRTVEYKPLFNPRAHQFGAQPAILNDAVSNTYLEWLGRLSYKKSLSDNDRLGLVYYLLLLDRVEKAIKLFAGIDPGKLNTKLQYDYTNAYIAMYKENVKKAGQIAAQYKDYPVESWRKKFATVTAQVAEINGIRQELTDRSGRENSMEQAANVTPSLECLVEAGALHISYSNIGRIALNYYTMDLELLFSKKPFGDRSVAQFSLIRPNSATELKLQANKSSIKIQLPDALKNNNVMIEVIGAGKREVCLHYANTLLVKSVEDYGLLSVLHRETSKPQSKVYVKVYAKYKDGKIRFYKDGYTDMRGKFDYASVSTEDLSQVKQFSLLIMSDEFGAVVKKLNPPTQ